MIRIKTPLYSNDDPTIDTYRVYLENKIKTKLKNSKAYENKIEVNKDKEMTTEEQNFLDYCEHMRYWYDIQEQERIEYEMHYDEYRCEIIDFVEKLQKDYSNYGFDFIDTIKSLIKQKAIKE